MALVNSELHFSLSLLKKLPLDQSIVYSPLSLSLALAIVHAGAKNKTKQQIQEILLKGVDEEGFINHFKNLSEALFKEGDSSQVSIANSVFSRNNFPIREEYVNNIKRLFQAEARNLDFSDTKGASDIINGFVKNATNGMIEKIIEPSSINDNTVAFIVNAIYFDALWEHEFDKATEGDFFTSENSKITVPFLSEKKKERRYAENKNVQMLQLLYKDNSYAYNIFLPKERFGLTKFLENVTADEIQKLLADANETLVDHRLPKMRIEYETKASNVLKELGICDLFSSTDSDLSGIADNIFVDEVMHKAVIEVDEAGTRASAATGIRVQLRCGFFGPPPIVFDADHPFFYMITKDDHPIFAGVYIS